MNSGSSNVRHQSRQHRREKNENGVNYYPPFSLFSRPVISSGRDRQPEAGWRLIRPINRPLVSFSTLQESIIRDDSRTLFSRTRNVPPFTNPLRGEERRGKRESVVNKSVVKGGKRPRMASVGTERYTVENDLRLGLYYLHAFAWPLFRRKRSSSMDNVNGEWSRARKKAMQC